VKERRPASSPAGLMKCPACANGKLIRCELEPALASLACRACGGDWVAFRVDHGTCGGTWLDPGEWEALRRRGLHRTLHRVFSPAWQAELTQRERRDAHDAMLLRKLGAEELAEVRRFGAWINGRPGRSELLAVLLEEMRRS
jgi:hypothetical protein